MNVSLYRILIVLRAGAASGDEVAARLKAMADAKPPSVPALYRHLRAALDAGWICVEGMEDTESRGRPAQRYGLTPRGEQVLLREVEQLQTLVRLALDGPDRG